MDQVEKMSYIAGLFDGDGSFTIMKKRPEADGRSYLYSPLIQFGSLDKKTIDFIKDEMDGTICFRKARIGKDGSNRRNFYFWRISGNERCSDFIKKVLPYLDIKMERAKYLLNYIIGNPFIRGSQKLTDEVIDEREASYLKMKAYNSERRLGRSIKQRSTKISQDKAFWPYLAGLLDTDGSFSIKKERARIKSCKYSPQISLSMTDARGINKIVSNCPFGTVTLIRAKTCTLGSCYRWAMASRKEISEFLSFVIPFLRVKKEQAEILKKFCDELSTTSIRSQGIPEFELAFRENCYVDIVNLNKYGVLKPSLIDSEALKQGDEAEDESHGERLSEKDSKEYATV